MDHGGHDASPARCNMNVSPYSTSPSLYPAKLTRPDALHLVDARPLYHLPQLAYHRPYNTHTLPPRHRRSRRWFRGAARYDGEVRCFAVEAEGGITSYVPFPPDRALCPFPSSPTDRRSYAIFVPLSFPFLLASRVFLVCCKQRETALNAPRRGTC